MSEAEKFCWDEFLNSRIIIGAGIYHNEIQFRSGPNLILTYKDRQAFIGAHIQNKLTSDFQLTYDETIDIVKAVLLKGFRWSPKQANSNYYLTMLKWSPVIDSIDKLKSRYQTDWFSVYRHFNK